MGPTCSFPGRGPSRIRRGGQGCSLDQLIPSKAGLVHLSVQGSHRPKRNSQQLQYANFAVGLFRSCDQKSQMLREWSQDYTRTRVIPEPAKAAFRHFPLLTYRREPFPSPECDSESVNDLKKREFPDEVRTSFITECAGSPRLKAIQKLVAQIQLWGSTCPIGTSFLLTAYQLTAYQYSVDKSSFFITMLIKRRF